MAGGPVGEPGVPVQLLVLLKDITSRKNVVKGLAPTPLDPRFHLAETARALTQTPALAADYLSAQVIHFVFFYKTAKMMRIVETRDLYLYSTVDGNWGPWAGSSACSVTCGVGQQSQRRLCDSPKPTHGGRRCQGEEQKQDFCTILVPCPSKWCDTMKY